jgi:hypothetical protein
MRKVRPQVPDGCEVVGFLYGSDDMQELGEDMLDVSLPNGLLISAGWFPEGSETGNYLVTVADGLEFVTPPLRSRDLDETRETVEFLARFYGGSSYLVPDTTEATTDIKYIVA